MKEEQLNELMDQALETELGGVQVYTTALRCVVNEDLREEWEKYLEQTQNHVQIVWTRELWIEGLGMKAVLPPPEEVKEVKTAIGAARAQPARGDMI